MHHSPISVQALTKDGVGVLAHLYKACFGREVNDSYFAWKYFNNPSGTADALVAYAEDQAVAFYGVIPERYRINDHPVTIHQSMDTMTHPDFQRRGLFTRLARELNAQLIARDGTTCLFGFPGSESFPGFVGKLQWHNACDLGECLAVTPSVLAARCLGSGFRRVLRFEAFERFKGTFDTYFLLRQPPRVAIQRELSAALLDWRVAQHPFVPYEKLAIWQGDSLIGFVVYEMAKAHKCRMWMVDFIDDQDFSPRLRAVATHLLRRTGAAVLCTWQPTIAWLQDHYKRAGFFTNPTGYGKFSYKAPFLVYSDKTKPYGVEWFNGASWHLQPLNKD